MSIFRPACAVTSFAIVIAVTSPVCAQDKLKVAIGQMEAWVNQAAVLSVHNVVLAFIQKHNVKVTPVQTGGLASTLTQVMSGQVDIGWATPPFGLREAGEGNIRIIADGNEVPTLRNQTVRVEIFHDSVAKDIDLAQRFSRAYRESLAYLLDDPRATKLYAAEVRVSEPLITEAIDRFKLKEGKQFDRISDLDAVMADGVAFKFLDKPLTPEQISNLVQILPPAI